MTYPYVFYSKNVFKIRMTNLYKFVKLFKKFKPESKFQILYIMDTGDKAYYGLKLLDNNSARDLLNKKPHTRTTYDGTNRHEVLLWARETWHGTNMAIKIIECEPDIDVKS